MCLSSLGRRRRVKLPALLDDILGSWISDLSEPAPTVQLIARDSFVAEVSIKIDQLCAEMRNISRDIEMTKGDIAASRDESERNFRFAAFQDADRRNSIGRHEALFETSRGRETPSRSHTWPNERRLRSL